MSRTTTVKFEWLEDEDNPVVKEYVIEKVDEKKIYFDKKLIPIKSLTELTETERKVYDSEKRENYNDDHSLLKASLVNFFSDEKGKADEKTYPHFGGDGVMYELTDALVLRVWSDKHIQENYTVSKGMWRIATSSKRYRRLPSCGNDLVDTDFNKLLDLLE